MVCGRQSFINVREAASVYDPYSGTRKSGYTRWNHRNKETNSVEAACLSTLVVLRLEQMRGTITLPI